MYLHGLLRAVEAAPAFHQPYHLHCTDKAGFPGAFYNILLPCGQLVPKIQKIQPPVTVTWIQINVVPLENPPHCVFVCGNEYDPP